jgi:ribokinase
VSSGRVVVVGHVGRDVVVRADELPPPGGSAPLTEWWEGLGGKGANQAVGLAQLGVDVALVGVVGTDVAGRAALAQGMRDGIDMDYVSRRGKTALLLDVVTGDGTRRLLEGVPAESLVDRADVERAAPLLRKACLVVLQLQQPMDALLRAAQIGYEAGARLVLDGGATGAERDALLALAHAVRADAQEAAMLVDAEVHGVTAAKQAAAKILAAGPHVVAIEVAGEGDLVAWHGGSEFLRYGETRVVDPTGAGDAFVAGLVAGLLRGQPAQLAGRFAARAAADTVARWGGRPDLTALA